MDTNRTYWAMSFLNVEHIKFGKKYGRLLGVVGNLKYCLDIIFHYICKRIFQRASKNIYYSLLLPTIDTFKNLNKNLKLWTTSTPTYNVYLYWSNEKEHMC